jgi:hypothetical protein
MAKKKIKFSPGDRLSIFIASIALISAIFTTYIQFFHKTTEFRIGSVDLVQTKDSLTKQLDINVLLINTGTNPVAYNKWYTFLSVDESLTQGACFNGRVSSQSPGIYTSNCSSRSEIIIEPNTVEFVNLELVISNIDFTEYMKLNKEKLSGQTPYINIGMSMTFIDSYGKKVTKEIIFGAVYYNDYGSGYISYVKTAKELKIY